MAKKTGMGGLNWIQTTKSANEDVARKIDGKEVRKVKISSISPDPNQPRKNVQKESADIQELAQSIKSIGFINFITVREDKKDQYIIVTGERRYTAAKVAGLKEIPVVVISDKREEAEYAVMQLEENLQREDLSPFEEAEALLRLSEDYGVQQKQICQWTGRSKSYVSKTMRINKITDSVRKDIEAGLEVPLKRDFLVELAQFDEETQERYWKKLRDEPTTPALKRLIAAEKMAKEQKPPKAMKKSDLDPDLVWEKLKRIAKKDKKSIISLIPKKKLLEILDQDI